MRLTPSRAITGKFLIAVGVTTVLGCVIQTQIILAEVQAMGGPVTPVVRLDTTLQDLVGFTPTFAGIVAATFLGAFPVAAWLGRRVAQPAMRIGVYAAAAAVGLGLAFQVADALAPMPTLIAATRGVVGTVWMMGSAVAGGLVFGALLARDAPRARALA